MRTRFFSLLVIILLLVSSIMTSPSIKNVQAASAPIEIGFNPFDSAIDPNKPVVYLTKLGSKTIYAVNYETSEIKTLDLPNPSEHIEIYKDKLYVTQLKMNHHPYNRSPYTGGIAEVDTQDFSLIGMIDIDIDPYDIAIDNDGYIYVSPGSGQLQSLKVYSSIDKKEVVSSFSPSIDTQSNLYFDSKDSKLYSLCTLYSPIDIHAFEINKGNIVSSYDSPYHGDYELSKDAKISPSGLFYISTGNVFELAPLKSGDMQYVFKLGENYTDYAFNENEKLTFAASNKSGIDVYNGKSNEYLYSIKNDVKVEKLLYNNGLLAIYKNDEKYYLEFIQNYGPEPLELKDSIYHFTNDATRPFFDGVDSIPTFGYIELKFNQSIFLDNNTRISLVGPKGPVSIHTYADKKGKLTIQSQPNDLEPITSYKLIIDNSAISGYLGNKLNNPITMNFRTEAPSMSNHIEFDSTNAPSEYSFTVKTSGGFEPEYMFLSLDYGEWKVVQDYSSNPTLKWYSNNVIGNHRFKVLIKNGNSIKQYDASIEFEQIIDPIIPQLTIKAGTTKPIKTDLTIFFTAIDNMGIKYIRMPNGEIIKGSDILYGSDVPYLITKNGTYYFKAEDLAGNIVTKSITISNIYKTPPAMPGVNEVWNSHTSIKGKTIANYTVTAFVNNKMIGSAKSSSTGSFTITIPRQSAGTKISVIVTDPAGNKSSARVVTVLDRIPPAIPVMNKVTSKTTTITGKTEKYATVYVYNGSKYLNKGTANSSGYYKISIKTQTKGSTLKFYATDQAKNKSKLGSVKVY